MDGEASNTTNEASDIDGEGNGTAAGQAADDDGNEEQETDEADVATDADSDDDDETDAGRARRVPVAEAINEALLMRGQQSTSGAVGLAAPGAAGVAAGRGKRIIEAGAVTHT